MSDLHPNVFDYVMLDATSRPGDIYDLIALHVGPIEFAVVLRTQLHEQPNSRWMLRTYYSFLGERPSERPADVRFWQALCATNDQLTRLETSLHKDRLVFCNRLIVKEITIPAMVTFERYHLILDDPARELFGNIPILKNPLFNTCEDVGKYFPGDIREWQKNTSLNFYTHLRKEAEWVVARGTEMVRNLQALSVMQNAKGAKTIIVSGRPGTGKENFAHSIHYSRVLFEPKKMKGFVLRTARDLENSGGLQLADALKKKIPSSFKTRTRMEVVCELIHQVIPTSELTIFIDELNKAKALSDMLSDFLRVTEQPKPTLGLKETPTFIFGSSDYLEDLAKEPPQDFWTRITHQLRVAHPLSRVSEDDAVDFLSGFFFLSWWKKTREVLGAGKGFSPLPKSTNEDAAKEFLEWAFGTIDRHKFTPSAVCRLAHNEIINTLAPLATKDELSVRGVGSIVAQVYSRVYWTRFAEPQSPWPDAMQWDPPEAKALESLRRIINDAIQDVLAVQNAARHTDRTPAPKAENSAG